MGKLIEMPKFNCLQFSEDQAILTGTLVKASSLLLKHGYSNLVTVGTVLNALEMVDESSKIILYHYLREYPEEVTCTIARVTPAQRKSILSETSRLTARLFKECLLEKVQQEAREKALRYTTYSGEYDEEAFSEKTGCSVRNIKIMTLVSQGILYSESGGSKEVFL